MITKPLVMELSAHVLGLVIPGATVVIHCLTMYKPESYLRLLSPQYILSKIRHMHCGGNSKQ